MKILFLAPQPFFLERGTPIAVRMAVETLARLGHTVDLLVYHEGEDVTIPGVRVLRIGKPPGVKRVPVGPSWKKIVCDVFFLGEFLRAVRRERYDVIHAVEEAAWMAHWTRPLHRLPFIVDMDSSIPSQLEETYPWARPLTGGFRRLEGGVLRGSVAIVAVCRELGEVARGHASTKPIAIIEDAALFDETGSSSATKTFREEFSIPAETPLVLYVGNLQKYQGIDLLLDAFARTKAPGALVIVGGDDAHIAQGKKRAAALGLDGRVHWAGPRPVRDLAWCLLQADLLVSPRLHGVNTPMKIYSYLASGIATLATDIPSHTQVLTKDVAVLTPPAPEPFAKGLDQLLRDAPLRRRLGENARRLARAEYSREAFDRKFERFYRDVEARMSGT
jgi:glycosyltransferase involved in cell wall biosynthesis